MAKRTTPAHGDRIVNTDTGETATIVDVHTGSTSKKKPAAGVKAHYSVLLDSGPRITLTWEDGHIEWEPPGARKCYRCGDLDHTAISCPKGDMP